MDYGSGIADDEHAAGHSPWGSSPPASPRRNQANYSSLGNEATYGYGAQDGSNGSAQDDLTGNAFNRPGTASSNASEPTFAESQPRQPSRESELGRSQDPSQQQQYQQAHQHPEQGQPVSQQQAHAPGQPPAQEQQQQSRRSTQPQYKLQAKITGLERTGRKDPILRFDVHVRLVIAWIVTIWLMRH